MAKNFKQNGDILMLAAGVAVASGTGYLFGTALFGVALSDVDSGVSRMVTKANSATSSATVAGT